MPGEPAGARVQLARRSSVRSAAGARRARPACAPACSAKSSWTQALPGAAAPVARSTPPGACARSAPASSGSSETGASGSADSGLQQQAEVLRHARRRSRRRTGRSCSRPGPATRSPSSKSVTPRSNLAPVSAAAQRLHLQAAQGERSQRPRSGARTSPGRAGCAAGSARGPAPRPAARRAGPGARRRPAWSRRTRRQQLAEAGIAGRGPSRSTRVLTKKPISPSSSGARAVGDRRCPPPGRPVRRSGPAAPASRRAAS